MTLLMFDNDAAKNHIKGKVCPKMNILSFTHPLMSFQPVLLLPIREKQKEMLAKMSEQFCCIQQKKNLIISFNKNK